MLIGPHAGTHLVEGGVMKARQILSCVLGFAAGAIAVPVGMSLAAAAPSQPQRTDPTP